MKYVKENMKSDSFRNRAAHYRRAAEKTNDPKLREQFHYWADDFEELAGVSQAAALAPRPAAENGIKGTDTVARDAATPIEREAAEPDQNTDPEPPAGTEAKSAS
jgi:hypothetical protein